MSYEKVSQADEVLIGTKQTLKALESNSVQEVIVADDAENRVIQRVLLAAEAKGVPIHKVDSMRKLGKVCGIDVGAAAVALKKQ
ncbi:large subunit ribosomal protein L7A [Alteribacillus persepolensis]|uniref:RNA-binding protein SAMN05192534_12034 n=1 Tax=Alteribacillus persepolensis TaxID=568899 RepID=A0A1G8HJR6_9BACI|nr:50S ribosomal protein L7ae-like protein [Alteribacillus persepolensis]SDI06690.1 large subunit ribosomal protein L7A [Alteribacillus persepolensis]